VISFGSELTGYYYAFIIIPALLYAVVPRAGEWLLWLTALSQFLSWAPIKHFPNWLQSLLPSSVRQSSFITNFSMPNGLDEQCTWISLGTLVVFVLIARELMLAPQPAAVPSLAGADGESGKEVNEPKAAPVLAPAVAQASRPEHGDSRPRRKHRGR
jgi:hypothetical protein